jgi:hypothetical protein
MRRHEQGDHLATGPVEGERPVAPGGWRRAAIGFGIGLAAGVVVALVLPRDDGPRRALPQVPADPDRW